MQMNNGEALTYRLPRSDENEIGETGAASWLRGPRGHDLTEAELRELRQMVVGLVWLEMGGNTNVDAIRKRFGPECAEWAKGELSNAYHRIRAREAEAERYRDCWFEAAIEAGMVR
jgi:hypothetical protein